MKLPSFRRPTSNAESMLALAMKRIKRLKVDDGALVRLEDKIAKVHMELSLLERQK